MGVADVNCTCGHVFAVSDDGNGAPHVCPRCKVQNVLPRRRSASSSAAMGGIVLGETGVRSTRVLSPVAAAHQSVVQGLPAGTMVGPYRIVRRVGRGGMGSVYEAIDERSSQRIALKVLSAELSAQPDFVARFHRESRALSTFSDKRIARVFFSGAAEGVPFFAMEFVDGRNLEEILIAEGVLKPERAIEWMREIAVGLDVAAQHGLVHRDVKPTNILIDDSGQVRIVDFGLAKALDSETRLTVTGAVVGTPFYLSPEQGLSKPVDQRSDIYSLGATFYHLLTGKPPFEADNSVSIILKHVHDAVPPIRDRNPRIPESLARIVQRCLSKEPRHRYQDYDELIRDLDAAKAGEPVSAPSESAIRRRAPQFVVVDDLEAGSLVLRRATRLRRFMALILDAAVVFAVAWLLRGRTIFDVAVGGASFLFAVVYFGLGDAFGGGTLGKQMFRLRVGKSDGGSIGILRGAMRLLFLAPLAIAPVLAWKSGPQLADLVAFLVEVGAIGREVAREWAAHSVTARNALFAAAGLDVLVCLLAGKGAALHDLLSGTAVFREELVKHKKRTPKERPLDPRIPLVASIVPGFGQLVNGEMGKGLAFFIAMAITAPVELWMFTWALAAYEAWHTAKQRADKWRRDHGGVS
jgi:uncharacterized RDD family membrane protein YckC/predicted Ser/Thr protein kinase